MVIHKNLIKPKSIVVIGGSDNIHSPGGRVLKNLIDHKFSGELFVVNPKKDRVQGLQSYRDIGTIPTVDLAIIAIAARFILETVKILTEQKNTKGFIIFSAGFSEKDEQGAAIEQEIVNVINQAGGSLLGPNNIGLLNTHYTGVFTTPIPTLHKKGVDFISGSGATAVFIMEAAQRIGLTFSSVYTVGNSAQIGVEEVLEYFDENFDKEESSTVKILYIESLKNPVKFLKHAISLVHKGCKIAAIKAGSSEAGNRAASSHTGAMATATIFVEALFKKAGIISCNGRNELITVAGILCQQKAKGNAIAIVTHAGGPAVMLTDILSKNGMKVPSLKGKKSQQLLGQLYDGSSVANPIDFLATGTAQQLETILEYCEYQFDTIDAIVVIFGSPGLSPVYEAYEVLSHSIKTATKPIYAILPSVVNATDEIADFISKGNIAFDDEVLFGKALAKVYTTPLPQFSEAPVEKMDIDALRKIINVLPDGYLPPKTVRQLLQYLDIPFVTQYEAKNTEELLQIAPLLDYPVVQKVVGVLHKSDVGGVILHVKNKGELLSNFKQLMQLKGATAVLIQPMKQGIELFIGAKRSGNFSPVVLCGFGGIYVEIFKDISVAMCPVSEATALEMISNLQIYPLLQGIRGQQGVDIKAFAQVIKKIAALAQFIPEIVELDINPLMANKDGLMVVDARIRVER